MDEIVILTSRSAPDRHLPVFLNALFPESEISLVFREDVQDYEESGQAADPQTHL